MGRLQKENHVKNDPYHECRKCGKWRYAHADEKHTFVQRPEERSDTEKVRMYKQLLEWLVMDFRNGATALKLRGEEPGGQLMSAMTDKIVEIVVRVEDDNLCHDDCKGMYFCTLAKGHDGKHSENGKLSW